jgi:signal transduction histidine kinase
MKQCFYNLAKNAVEAMPEGGVLRVGMATVRIGAEETLPLREGDHLRITFSDSGVGISRENLPKVFDPYFTTKQMGAVKGTGLGLAVCYSVVKQHGGHIELLSEPGQGTEVRIYLPVLRTPAAGTEFSPGVDDRDGKDA